VEHLGQMEPYFTVACYDYVHELIEKYGCEIKLFFSNIKIKSNTGIDKERQSKGGEMVCVEFFYHKEHKGLHKEHKGF
jgi:hypothetical protein